MKKRRFFAILSLLLGSMIIFLLNVILPKTQNDIIGILQQELELVEGNYATISYVGEFGAEKNVLLWFSAQNGHQVLYRAVECLSLNRGRYLIKNINKPTAYAQNIVHTVWMAEDVVLINNPNCQAVVYSDQFENVISRIDISPNDLPYIFSLEWPDSSSKCDFIDIAGNSIR